MSKTVKNVKKGKQRPKSTASVKPQPKTEEPDSDNPFDFGGMPARDLKKNLGCG